MLYNVTKIRKLWINNYSAFTNFTKIVQHLQLLQFLLKLCEEYEDEKHMKQAFESCNSQIASL